jgi:hypothetical protein
MAQILGGLKRRPGLHPGAHGAIEQEQLLRVACMSSIDFRKTEPFYEVRGNIVLFGNFGQKRVRCSISAEVLKERFGAKGDSAAELFEAFLPNQPLIEEAFSRKFGEMGRHVDAVVLRLRDL